MAKKTVRETEQIKRAMRKKTALTVNDTTGDCLSLSRAGAIVQQCSKGPHDIDLSLEEVGLITDNQRLVFRECLYNGVLAGGCVIERSDIPTDADNTLREVRDGIKNAAS